VRSAPWSFHDKVVIVTGAGGGIGLATAHRFAGAGARVVVAEFDEARARPPSRRCVPPAATRWRCAATSPARPT
jgi:NAD(P)-dependent dehydrogenase (short-subunit alcohol dehydrogenase family)